MSKPERACDHDWVLPGSISEELDEAKQIQGYCRECGCVEDKPLIVWFNMLDAMIQRLQDENKVSGARVGSGNNTVSAKRSRV